MGKLSIAPPRKCNQKPPSVNSVAPDVDSISFPNRPTQRRVTRRELRRNSKRLSWSLSGILRTGLIRELDDPRTGSVRVWAASGGGFYRFYRYPSDREERSTTTRCEQRISCNVCDTIPRALEVCWCYVYSYETWSSTWSTKSCFFFNARFRLTVRSLWKECLVVVIHVYIRH